MDLAELRGLTLFDGLDDDQLAALLASSTEHVMRRGELLFQEGRPADCWWVLLEAPVALIKQVGTEESVLGYMTTPGQWAGGFAAWDEFGVYVASARAENPGRVLRLEAPELHRLSVQWFPFGLHFIEGLVKTVRRIESTARQREALVALGTLSAGLAHELNNPASAATRAVDSLQGTSAALLMALSTWPGLGSRPRTSPPWTSCGYGSAARNPRSPRSTWPTERTSCPTGSWPTTWTATGRSLPPSRQQAPTSHGARSSLGGCLPPPSPPPWSGCPRHSRRPRCSVRSRRRPAGSPRSSPLFGPTRRWTGPRSRRPTSWRGWTARW
ncbi:hypothetical protein GCM10023153_05000 [Ornithinibacter aureus]|uniref:Cyclic nucleotide-binding domain-containing protein n=1 Tax=Ornithinibacter aureus TaxID=622664 RepID=A0ABP8JDE5_9MICO|nr:cyclic nucleotide-binding domain-containing protein [Ornithinibacter aureus]